MNFFTSADLKRDQARRCLKAADKAGSRGRFVREKTFRERAARLMQEASGLDRMSTEFSPYDFDITTTNKSLHFWWMVHGCKVVVAACNRASPPQATRG